MCIAPRHSLVPKNELWEECQIESHENHQRGELCPAFRVHATRDLRKPEMYATQVCHYHPADHHIVKVRNHEIGVGDVDIYGHGRQEKPCQAADSEQSYETERIEHRSLIGDRSLIHRRGPIEYLNRGWDRYHEAEEREHHARVHGLSGDEQVMSPHQKSQYGYGDARYRDKGVTENRFA